VSFRARLAIVAAAAVALAVILASGVVYVVVRDQLRGQVDAGLRHSANALSHRPPEDVAREIIHPEFGGIPSYPQVVRADGFVPPGQPVSIPVTKRVRSVARGTARSFFADAHINGAHVRVYTVPYSFTPGYAIELARPLADVDRSLRRIQLYLLLIAGGGVLVAAALGLAVARTALRPVRRMTSATETVAETGDLSERIDAHGRDELSRLAASFNAMMGALEESKRMQQQLVADASHELRTPLTSLRTNIEVLASERTLPPGERERLLTDVVEQLGEMTTLVAELIELARDEQHVAEERDVRLDLVAGDAVERTRRNRPGVTFATDLEESVVRGIPETIERAVANMLDNAAKWSPPGGEVEVAVRNGSVTVRDHGPGIDDEDLQYVFDRFYRARSARGLPGSGLGLAIVRQVAEAHGGDVKAERAEGGGTRLTMTLNGEAAPDLPH
jgi:two-component system, OmpR family, sensor histidine kinase MprB